MDDSISEEKSKHNGVIICSPYNDYNVQFEIYHQTQ